MNISQRLRTCAKHTGLDAVIELLQEAADEIDALQARAQVQGEAFGYIHHFAAHDERGVLIDTTWEADGCADPLPHPTFPSMWKWTHCTPFYTTQQPATGEPVGYMNEGHIHELAMGRIPYGYVYPEAGAGASTAVYTHQAPSVPDEKPLPDLMMASYHEAIGWNACRAAMLAAKDSK